MLLVAKISDSQYSMSKNTSCYCNSEENLWRKSLMKLKHRVAYQRKWKPSKRSRLMEKNLKSGEVSQKSLWANWINTIWWTLWINTMDKHYWTKAEGYLGFFLQYLKKSTWVNIFPKKYCCFHNFLYEKQLKWLDE